MIILFQNILFSKEFLACSGCFGLFTKIKKGSGTSFSSFSGTSFPENVIGKKRNRKHFSYETVLIPTCASYFYFAKVFFVFEKDLRWNAFTFLFLGGTKKYFVIHLLCFSLGRFVQNSGHQLAVSMMCMGIVI